MTDNIREAFEKFHAEHLRKIGMDEHDIATERDRLENGDYQWSMAAEAWPYWQAAVAQQPATAVPDALPLQPFTTIDRGSKNYAAGWNACRAAMLAAAPAAPVAQEPVAWMRCDEYPSVTASGAVLEDWRRQRVVIRPLYAAPPAAEQPATGHELFSELYQILGALGASEAVLDQVLAASQGEPLPHASLLPYAAGQSDTVKVPRELLERAVDRLEHGHELDKACRELRALLAGGAE